MTHLLLVDHVFEHLLTGVFSHLNSYTDQSPQPSSFWGLGKFSHIVSTIMTHIPQPERTSHNKVVGEFYPVQPNELIALRQAKLINNIAFVHFALRFENPFCDRPVTIIVKEFALKWNIPEPSVYKALSKLDNLGILHFKRGKVTVEWNLSNSTPNYQDGKKIINFDNSLSDPIENYQIRENETPKPLPDKDCGSPQTPQTFLTLQTAGGEEKIQSEPAYTTVIDDGSPSADPSPQLTELSSILDKTFPDQNQIDPEDKSSPDCHTNDTKALTNSQDNATQNTPVSPPISSPIPKSSISSDLLAKLKDLKIPLDGAVKKAIADHHSSQVWGALRHIEETSEDIRSPRGVFLYQVPRQPKDNRKPPSERFTDEFKHWYQQAIASGLVINRPFESLGLYQSREPIVELQDGSQWPWTQVRDGKHLPPTQEELEKGFEQHKKLIENLRANSPQYQSSQEKAKQQLEFKLVPPSQDIPLPPHLEAQLSDLGIPLNAVVRKAITSHPLAVIEGIINLVREKLSAIGESGGQNAHRLFTYQLMTL